MKHDFLIESLAFMCINNNIIDIDIFDIDAHKGNPK